MSNRKDEKSFVKMGRTLFNGSHYYCYAYYSDGTKEKVIL